MLGDRARRLIGALFSSRRRDSSPDETLRDDEATPEPATVFPATDTIDLHTFRPSETRSVVEEFIDAALDAGFERIRIVHGKGIGVQRRIVRDLLDRHPAVVSFGDAADGASWGATVAVIRRPAAPQQEDV